MNLLESRRSLKFLRRISQHFLIGEAVVNPLPVHVHDGDHVCCILTDQVKELLSFHQLTADPVDQKMLIDRVEVEEENQAHQASYGLRPYILICSCTKLTKRAPLLPSASSANC